MTKKSRVKTIIIFLFLVSLSAALYFASQRHKWDLGWDKGLLSESERQYYSERFERIIKYWAQKTPDKVKTDRYGWLDESYNAYLVVDLDKKGLWVEENGQINTENYIDFPPETNWTFYHVTPDDVNELTGRTMLKIRGTGTNRRKPEKFYLVGTGGKGSLYFDIATEMSHGGYRSGSFVVPNEKIYIPTVSADKIYPSLIVTEDEYQQYLKTLPDSNTVVVENEKIKAWNKIEKYLYMEIERQFPKKGYKLGSVSIEPGPDFSAARAQISVRKENIIDRIKGHRDSILIYQNIDHIGNDIWYAKSVPNPYPDPSKTKENKPVLDIEFLSSPNEIVKGSKYEELLKKGRELQQAPAIPESKWKATLFDGAKIEFLGIRENRSKESLWWGPDGSLIDYRPNYNTEPIDRFFKLRTIYEMAWRVTPPRGFPFVLEGCTDMHCVYSYTDRYGNIFYSDYFIDGFYFEPSRKATTLKIGYSNSDWKTALEIKDEQGEIQFLDKYKVILEPPEVKDGKIIISCFKEFSTLINYVTDFAIVVNGGSETKTISLYKYQYGGRYLVDRGGLDKTVFKIDDLDISQIESVCFRYRPYGAIFKNISLVPGQDQGFEIEVIEAEE